MKKQKSHTSNTLNTPNKKIKLKSTKQLKSIAYDLWKQLCFLRDGRECQVKKFYPSANINHSDILQVDHCFTRQDKNLFFEPDNGTVVCSNCNLLKHLQSKSVHRLIDKIVVRRIGQNMFDKMQMINSSMNPNLEFSKRHWLEDKIKHLEQRIDELTKLTKSKKQDGYSPANPPEDDLIPYQINTIELDSVWATSKTYIEQR